MNLFELYQKKYDELYEVIVPSIDENFKLPIQYIDNHPVNEIIKNDLEMVSTYKNLIGESILIDNWTSYYTTNKSFLKDTQKHIVKLPYIQTDNSILDSYKKFKGETSFIEKYQYIGIKTLKKLNYSTLFLHGLGLYNLASPIISLFTPLFILIIPFIILKFKGLRISISNYISFLKQMIKQNSIYNFFTNFNQINSQQKISTIITIFFYFFQVYSNVMSCISFYRNIHSISTFLENYKCHIKESINTMDIVQNSIVNYNSYKPFYDEIEIHKRILLKLFYRLNDIYPFKNTLSKIGQLGIIMNLNYEIYMESTNDKAFMFSIFLNQYITDVNSIKSLVKTKINKCKFNKDNCITKLEGMYYLPLINETPVLNDIDLSQNIMITGPNASGKTTILKALLINLLMSQQFGYGCYKKASIKIYDVFHSYLNIPDTSGRDSLFQAEARRCKDILVSINNKGKHCCIFDELYSGTNPSDAVECATIYLDQMNKFDNVDYVLTTHYIKLCEDFDKKILNIKMDVNVTDNIEYLYKISKGISYVHGGKQVLKDLNYNL